MKRWAFVVFLVLVPAARADVVATTRYVPPTGPALTDGGVAWADDRGAVRVGAGPVVFAGGATGIVASGDRLGVSTVLDLPAGKQGGTFEASAFVGPVAGPLSRASGPCLGIAGLDVTADATVLPDDGCRRLVVREADGSTLTLPEGARGPVLAGHFVAFREQRAGYDLPSDLVVDDLSTSGEAVRVPADESDLAAYDLDADGTLVVARYDGGVSVQRPDAAPRVLLARSKVATLRVAHGRAVITPRTPGAEGSPAPLRLLDLTTGSARDLGVRAYPAFDFDGTRVTWLAPACERVRLLVAPVASAKAPPVGRCPPLRLLGRPVLSSTARRVRFRFSCAGTYRDCLPFAPRLTTARRPRRSILLPGSDGYARDGSVSVAMTAAVGRRLRAGRSLRVRLSVDLGDQGRRALTVTLRR